jgi:hypothetical protein
MHSGGVIQGGVHCLQVTAAEASGALMEVALGIIVALLVCLLYTLVAHIRDDIAIRERMAERFTRIEAKLHIK